MTLVLQRNPFAIELFFCYHKCMVFYEELLLLTPDNDVGIVKSDE